MATFALSLTGNNKLDILISSGAKKVAQLLVGIISKPLKMISQNITPFLNMFAIAL